MHGQPKNKYRGRDERGARDLGRQQRHQTKNLALEGRTRCLNRVEMVSKGSLTPGRVVQARVEFQDGTGDKVRPVLVLGCIGNRVIVRVFTTSEKHARRSGGGDRTVLNGRRCWLANDAIELDRSQILTVLDVQLDELAGVTANSFITVA